PHIGARNGSLVGLRVRPAEALIVAKEVSFAPQKIRKHRTTCSYSKTAVVIVRNRSVREIVLPGVRVEVVVEVVFVRGSMEPIGSALGYDGDLSTRRAVEISSLIGSVDFEFFDAVRRRRHHARWL